MTWHASCNAYGMNSNSHKVSLMGRISRILSATTSALKVISGVSRNDDYLLLSNYIININRLTNIDDVLLEVSRCLKELLDYEVFGFAVRDEDRFDIWIDPRMYREQVLKIVERDFKGPMLEYNLHHFSDQVEHATGADLDADAIRSYAIKSSLDLEGMLYVQPRKDMLDRHHDILNTVVNSLGVALENLSRLQRLQDEASVDPLTGCYNRRTFARFISHELANVRRHGGEVAMIMFDLDHFKKVNDTYGHQAGDIVLKQVASLVRSTVRNGDYVVRYGGEEFLVVLPKCGLYKGMMLAERLRAAIEAMVICLPDGQEIKITSSFGVASLREAQELDSLVHEADLMLYKAKKTRNAVVPSLNIHSELKFQSAL